LIDPLSCPAISIRNEFVTCFLGVSNDIQLMPEMGPASSDRLKNALIQLAPKVVQAVTHFAEQMLRPRNRRLSDIFIESDKTLICCFARFMREVLNPFRRGLRHIFVKTHESAVRYLPDLVSTMIYSLYYRLGHVGVHGLNYFASSTIDLSSDWYLIQDVAERTSK